MQRDKFKDAGFLSRQTKLERHNVRTGSEAFFNLADDLNFLMMQTARAATNTTQGHNWTKETVAVRLLLRTIEAFQSVILLSERGIVSPARTLVRTIVENSLCAAALLEKPDEIIKLLREDAEASRRRQAIFINDHQLGDSPETKKKIREAIQTMERKPGIKWNTVAQMSAINLQYLNYLHLSDSAVHTSATSLDRYIARSPEGDGWSYRFGPGLPEDIAKNLHGAMLAAVPVMIVVTKIMGDNISNSAIASLTERFRILQTQMEE